MASVDRGAGAAGDAAALAVVAQRDPDAGGLVLAGVDQHHVGDVDRPFLLDHAPHGLGPLGVTHLLGALVALDDVQALHIDPLTARVHAQDLAALAAVLPADDRDGVAATDLH